MPNNGGGDFWKLEIVNHFQRVRIFPYGGFRIFCGAILGGKNLQSVLSLGGEISSC